MANAEVLAKAPSSAPLSEGLGTDMSGFKAPRTRGELTQAQYQNRRDQAAAEVAAKKSEMDVQLQQAESKAQSSKDFAQTMRDQEAARSKKLEENQMPTFKPTQDDAIALGQLFSLIATTGMMLGNSGKMSGVNSMNAMTGMLEGFSKGRADLFKQQKDIYDKEFQKMKAIREDIKNDFDRYKELLATDREAAEDLKSVLIAKAGQNSILGKQLELGNLKAAGETLEGVDKTLTKAEERAFELTKMQKQFENQLELKKREAALKQGVALPKEKELGQYRARFETIKNIDEIESLLKDPEFRRIVNPTTAITPALLQNLRDEYPQLANKLARVQAIEFQTGGKALTASEQKILEPIYGWRGKTAEALESQLGETKRSLELTQGLYEKDYPGLVARKPMYEQAYGQLGTLSTLPMEQAEQTTYKVGDIVSKGGKQYKVTGVYQDDPSNPEVEEIK